LIIFVCYFLLVSTKIENDLRKEIKNIAIDLDGLLGKVLKEETQEITLNKRRMLWTDC